MCGKVYNARSSFKIHRSSHVEEKKYKCRKYKNEYRHLKDLVYHKRHVHMGVTFECKFCKIKFSKNDSLNEHRTAHERRRYFCKVCNKAYCYRSSLGKVTVEIGDVWNRWRGSGKKIHYTRQIFLLIPF